MSRKGLLRKSLVGGVSDFLNRVFDGQAFGYIYGDMEIENDQLSGHERAGRAKWRLSRAPSRPVELKKFCCSPFIALSVTPTSNGADSDRRRNAASEWVG
jgi:hypothetical protein